jgi:hypothetical protein
VPDDGYVSPDEDDAEGIDDGDRALEELFAAAQVDVGARQVRDHQVKLQHDTSKLIPDTANLQCPFPGLMSVLNTNLATPEALALLEFPFPMGHTLSDKERATGVRDTDDAAVAKDAANTFALASYEEELNKSVQLLTNTPNARKVGVIAAMTTQIQRTGRQIDLQTEIESKKIPAPVLDARRDASRITAIVDAQKDVVELALVQEGQRARTSPHQALFEKTSEPDSHNEFMGIGDFLPFAFVYRPDRTNVIRETIVSYLREQFYTNKPDLPPVERERAEGEIRSDAESMVQQIAENEVDNIASYFYDTDALLQYRVRNQVHAALLRKRVDKLVGDLKTNNPPNKKELIARIENSYPMNLMEFRIKAGEQVLEALRSSDVLADALKSPDYRGWFLKNCNAESMVALGADRPVLTHDATPFNGFIQLLADFVYGDLGTRAGGVHLYFVTMHSALDSQYWAVNRILPTGNVGVLGATGTGKSLNARSIETSMPPGIVQSLSTFSAQAFTTSTNNDNIFIIQEEGKASLLAPNKDDRDRGGSNEINLLKDLWTRFSSVGKRAYTDKETGTVKTLTTISSAHNSTMLNSNLNIAYLDGPLARRMILYVVAQLIGAASITLEQFEELDMFRDEFIKRDNVHRQQITFAMYQTLRSLIKAGVLPLPDRTSANMVVVAVLKELGLKVDSTGLNRFIQFAENYQLFFAAHMLCWSPYQACYHTSKEGAPRWSAQSIIELAPFYTATVGLSSTLFALTTLEFTVIPMHVDSFLRDVVTMLHVATPAKRTYRRFEGIDKHDKPVYDVNYLVIEGKSATAILDAVAACNSLYKLRAMDVESFIEKINQTAIHGKGFVVPPGGFADDGRPLRIAEEGEGADITSFRPIDFEENVGGGRGGKKWRMVVSLRFLESHFKKSVLNPDDWKNMSQLPASFDESRFTRANAEGLGYVRTNDSPMARAIEKVLSNRTLNLSPADPHNGGWPAKCYEFITGYMPNPVQLRVQVPETEKTHKPHEYRRGIDGVMMIQRLERNPARAAIFRENAHILTPTAAEALRLRTAQKKVDGFTKWQAASRQQIAFTSDKYDSDYVTQQSALKKLGQVIPNCFLRILGYSEEEITSFADVNQSQRLPTVIPLGFGPLSYMMQRAICRKLSIPVGTVVYPRDNIYEQLQRSMLLTRYKLTPPALLRKQDRAQVTDLDAAARHTPVGKIFFGDEDGDSESVDEADVRDAMRLQSFVDSTIAPAVDAMDIDT